MRPALRWYALLGLSAALCACAGPDESGPDDEAAEETATAALSGQTQLTDDEATASINKGSCEIKAGDLIFQRSGSEQAGAIAYLTKSELTHVGVVFKVGGAFRVYEAVGPVKLTPLNSWIARGQGSKFATSRYKDGMNANMVKGLFNAGKPFYGKPYDVMFSQDEANIYCSELALKMYERTSVYWINALWSMQFGGLWKRVDRLDGWSTFQADLRSPSDSSPERLVKKIMSARGMGVDELRSQVLVAPLDLSDESRSGGLFRRVCELAAR
jgi:hypothetical protein